jgi:hypothetical protein
VILKIEDRSNRNVAQLVHIGEPWRAQIIVGASHHKNWNNAQPKNHIEFGSKSHNTIFEQRGAVEAPERRGSVTVRENLGDDAETIPMDISVPRIS